MVNRTCAGWLFVLWGHRPGRAEGTERTQRALWPLWDHLGLLPDAVKPGIHRVLTTQCRLAALRHYALGSGVSWRPTGSGAHEP